jgi:hypothetical protein
MYCWVDFSCGPQRHSLQQRASINSLPLYASVADALLIVAPKTVHGNTGEELGPESYKLRMWCRAELVRAALRSLQSSWLRPP